MIKTKQRVYFFDNLKFLLIILVVIGHVINFYIDSYKFFRIIFIFIYTFHMPLFVFITGLFQKKITNYNNFPWKRILYYLILVYCMKITIFSISNYFKLDEEIRFLGGAEYYWYLVVISFYIICNPIINKINFKFLFIFSIIISLTFGYDASLGDLLYLSRTIVFFPFYLLGYKYCNNKEQLLSFFNKKRFKIIALIILISFSIICIKGIDLIYEYRRLLTGKNSYLIVFGAKCEWYHRLVYYIASLLVGMSILFIVPKRKIKIISNLGKKTLQIYILHQPLNYFFMGIGLYNLLEKEFGNLYFKFILLLIAIIITFFLSLNLFRNSLKHFSNIIFTSTE
ncbi:MAG: acyltransferase family protein [Bacilli bacterium]|nr:acyltransferase family protein [Bacilli bacterium]